MFTLLFTLVFALLFIVAPKLGVKLPNMSLFLFCWFIEFFGTKLFELEGNEEGSDCVLVFTGEENKLVFAFWFVLLTAKNGLLLLHKLVDDLAGFVESFSELGMGLVFSKGFGVTELFILLGNNPGDEDGKLCLVSVIKVEVEEDVLVKAVVERGVLLNKDPVGKSD